MDKLKREIYKSGKTLAQFCEEIGISRFTLVNLGNGRSKKPRGSTIYLIAVGLGKTYEEVEEMFEC